MIIDIALTINVDKCAVSRISLQLVYVNLLCQQNMMLVFWLFLVFGIKLYNAIVVDIFFPQEFMSL